MLGIVAWEHDPQLPRADRRRYGARKTAVESDHEARESRYSIPRDSGLGRNSPPEN